VCVYLGAITAGLAAGTLAPAMADRIEILLWPVLGLLLYATFTQVPLTHLPGAFRDVRFIGAVLTGSFLLVPLLVAALLPLVPAEPHLHAPRRRRHTAGTGRHADQPARAVWPAAGPAPDLHGPHVRRDSRRRQIWLACSSP
jgi:hypothetical protein